MAEIVPLRGESLSDVSAMLRKTADAIEAGEHGAVAAAVLVLEIGNSDDLAVFGFGKLPTTVHTVGVTEAAKVRLIR